MIGIEIKGDLGATVRGIQEKLKNPAKFWGRVGTIMKRSTVKNFSVGGRPTPWKPSQRAIKDGGRTLVDSKKLVRSIRDRKLAANNGVAIGTPVKYGRVHNNGFVGTVAVPSHTRTITKAFGKSIPARKVNVKGFSKKVSIQKRQFLIVLKEDWTSIKKAFYKHMGTS